MNLEIFERNLEIIINRNLVKRGIIDENVFTQVQEKLLKKIKELG